MSRKVYQQKNQFSNSSAIRIDVKGKSKTVTFESKRRNGLLTYETEDADIQSAIESTKQFEAGKITCIEGTVRPQAPKGVVKKEVDGGDGGDAIPVKPEVKKTEVVEYAEVTEFQAAKEILRSEPYLVPFQALNSIPNILKKAEEVGVSFPNLKVAE